MVSASTAPVSFNLATLNLDKARLGSAQGFGASCLDKPARKSKDLKICLGALPLFSALLELWEKISTLVITWT